MFDASNASGHTRNAAPQKSRVVVFGAGIAGLTAAHELAQRGCAVTIIEPQLIAGGRARSFGVPQSGADGRLDLPAEHGYRVFCGHYLNLDETMRRIPLSGGGSTYDNLVPLTHYEARGASKDSVTIPLDLFKADRGRPFPANLAGYVRGMRFLFDVFVRAGLVPRRELYYFVGRMLYFGASCEERRYGEFEQQSWREFIGSDNFSSGYRTYLDYGMCKMLQAMQPAVGNARVLAMLLTKVYTAMMSRKVHGFRVLNGPTNEALFDPWTERLRELGVQFRFGCRLAELCVRNGNVAQATVLNDHGRHEALQADQYVLALSLKAAQQALAALPANFLHANQLQGVARLRNDDMNGVMLFLKQPLPFDAFRLCYRSPWGVSYQAKHLLWDRRLENYGDAGVRGLLSCIVSDWSTPGLNGKPARDCSAEEIVAEVIRQINADRGVSRTLLCRDDLSSYCIDPAIKFHGDGASVVENSEPLYVNSVGDTCDRPASRLPSATNLSLAGTYVRSHMDYESMEAANESGKRAANAVLGRLGLTADVPVLDQPLFPWLESMRRRDRAWYAQGKRHPLDFSHRLRIRGDVEKVPTNRGGDSLADAELAGIVITELQLDPSAVLTE